MKKWLSLSYVYLIIIAVIGTWIRFGYCGWVGNFNINHLTHTHSHVAFQGWLYPIITLFLTNYILNKDTFNNRGFKLYFFSSHALIPLILVSFLYQGYGLFSIIFSSIFQLINYGYIIKYYKESKTNQINDLALKLSKWSLVFLFLSTLGPWLLAILSAKGLKDTDFYKASIYLYLHFQYNGFFLTALIAFFVRYLKEKQILFPPKNANTILYTLVIGTLLSYFSSIIGMDTFKEFWLIGAIGAILLCIGSFYLLYPIRKSQLTKVKTFSFRTWLYLPLVVFVSKPILQLLSSIPLFSTFALHNRYIIIGYMHWVLIGLISLSTLFFLWERKAFVYTKSFTLGMGLFILAFLVSEILIFSAGLGGFYPFKTLAIVTSFMPIGLIISFRNLIINKT